MAERERTVAPGAAVFVARTQVMSADDIRRAVTRIAHEIVERNHGLAHVMLVALQTGGAPLATRIAAELKRIEGYDAPIGTLDVVPYRDDYGIRPFLPEAPTDIPGDITGKTIVLVDDVLFTGRTVRAALNALADFGRAQSVQLAVMVDRGHREVPIRPDFVGKNLPTRRDEMVDVREDGVFIGEMQPK